MPRFRFSLFRLQKLQKQKHRLAGMETVRRKAALDASVKHLNELNLRFDKAAADTIEKSARDPRAAESDCAHLRQLSCQIELARQRVDEITLQWQRAIGVGQAPHGGAGRSTTGKGS